MRSLSKPIQSRINRYAHRQALEHERRIKAELTAQILKARTDGASFDDLVALVDKLEAPGIGEGINPPI